MYPSLVAHTVSPYVAILALLFLGLSARIANRRRLMREGKAVDAASTERGIRAQVNFAEHVPFALLLIWLLGAVGTSLWLVHLLGLFLVVGRIAHVYGLLVEEPQKTTYHYRAFGMALTYLVFAVASIGLLIQWCSLLLQ